MNTLTADHLVVGAGAAGLAFADALVDHSDARVVVTDRRDGPGGHWRDAYPFVRLHQASQFYGVASTPLGEGLLQTSGPEAGLHERATGAEVCAYYERVVARLEATGRVEFRWTTSYDGAGGLRSRSTGARTQVPDTCRIVDAHYLSPATPADTPPPFDFDEAVPVLPVGRLPDQADAGSFVIVGAGKTATDAIVWLLSRGTDPDAICWVRPRDPWMLNRAKVQPEPSIFNGMVADVLESAILANSIDDLFLRLEAADVMLRIDRDVTPTMARAPTLARWELEMLRSIENVVRLGHLKSVAPRALRLDRGDVAVARDAVVVHCAAEGLRRPGLVQIWTDSAITLQPVRPGFPCFGAALIGYVEATRPRDDAVKNEICAPSPLPSTPAQWAEMMAVGMRASAGFLRHPDIAAWSENVLLNPARVPAGYSSDVFDEARERIATSGRQGVARLAVLAGEPAPAAI